MLELNSWGRRLPAVIVAWVVSFAVLLLGCSATPPQVPHRGTLAEVPAAPLVGAAASPPNVPTAKQLTALSERERDLSHRLKDTVEQLVRFGERTVAREWNLSSATDFLASELIQAGYEPSRVGVSGTLGALTQNLVAHVRGHRRGFERIVISARYDTLPGSTGLNDNASGTALLLELARTLAGQTRQRSIDFLFYSDASARKSDGANGARLAAENYREANTAVVGAIELWQVGHYSEAPGSQRYPDPALARGSLGEFAALIGHPEFASLSERVFRVVAEASSLPLERFVVLRDSALCRGSGHLFFAGAGFPSLLLTDTGSFRAKPDAALDYARLGRLTAALETALGRWAGPKEPASDDG